MFIKHCQIIKCRDQTADAVPSFVSVVPSIVPLFCLYKIESFSETDINKDTNEIIFADVAFLKLNEIIMVINQVDKKNSNKNSFMTVTSAPSTNTKRG